jgi:uncharacterized protein (TIGR02145 family)
MRYLLTSLLLAVVVLSSGCDPEEFEVCGDLITHDGYNYSTVQIGEQCWFAENCRYLPSVIFPSVSSPTIPYYYVYGYEGTDVEAAKATANYDTYGVLYNGTAVMTEGLCPSGWHIPSDEEWQTMEMSLGMSEADASSDYWRGTDEGFQMKSTQGWDDNSNETSGNGSNSSGFNGLPGGFMYFGGFTYPGVFLDKVDFGFWHSSSDSAYSWSRELSKNYDNVNRSVFSQRNGLSARCVRDD